MHSFQVHAHQPWRHNLSWELLGHPTTKGHQPGNEVIPPGFWGTLETATRNQKPWVSSLNLGVSSTFFRQSQCKMKTDELWFLIFANETG